MIGTGIVGLDALELCDMRLVYIVTFPHLRSEFLGHHPAVCSRTEIRVIRFKHFVEARIPV